jgi:hypothetical protein
MSKKIDEAKVRAFFKSWLEAAKANEIQRQQRIDGMVKHVDEQIQIYLNGWEIQAQAALSVAQQPPDDDSKVFWFIALGGNLLWAAASLNPEAVGVNIIISFAGAAIGSGSIEQLYKNPPEEPGDAKQLAVTWITAKRDKFESEFMKSERKWAEELVGLEDWEAAGTQTDKLIDVYHAYIWRNMFPRIPYTDQKFSTILSGCTKNINAMLADFKVQWQQYRQMAAWYGGAERKKHNIYFKYTPSIIFDMEGTGEVKPIPYQDPLKFH